MALALMIDGVDYISELIHESLRVNQTNDGLNSTCQFEIEDTGVIQADAWTVEVTRVEDGDVITGHTTFSEPKVEVSVVDGATVYFAGVLSRIVVRPRGVIAVGGYVEPPTQVLRCDCHDFSALLEESVIDSLEEYVNETDEAVIDDIFTKYVTGIDFATHVDGGAFTFRSISFEDITVRQAMDLIVARTGYIWYVDYSKKLHYSEAEANAPAWHLSDQPDDVNSFSYLDPVGQEKDATNLVNKVFIVAGTGGTWFQDATSIATYGTHQAIVRDARLSLTESIAARGAALLDKFANPITIYEVRTYKDGLRAGMHVRFVCAYLDVDDTFLINRLEIEFPVDGEPVYALTLGGLESSVSGAAQRFTLDQLYSGPPVPLAQLPLASRGWGHDMTFSATDADTVAWDGGTLTTASGQDFTIAAGNTDDPGAMTVKTIVYLDTAISLTALQMTTDETAALGYNRIMVAVCWPGAVGAEAGFQVFGASSEGAQSYLNADNVAANSLTANEIYGNTLSVIAADMGTLTAGAINITGGGAFGRILLSVGGIALYDVADNRRMWLNANDGTLEFSSAEDGNPRIEIGSTEIAGYDGADVKQFYLSAATGVAYAGAGAVWLDEDGLSLAGADAVASTIKWVVGGVIIADQKAYVAANEKWMYIQTLIPASNLDRTKIYLEANAPAGSDSAVLSIISGRAADAGWASFHIEGAERLNVYGGYVKAFNDLRVQGGLYVGADADPDDNDIWCDGEISTDGGTTRYNWGGHNATGDVACSGYIDIQINGVARRIMCRT